MEETTPRVVPTSRSDEETLIRAAQRGDELASAAILRRYRDMVRSRARWYFVAGGDREDVIQEGMIGLYKAIRDYDAEMAASFRSFAELCVTRQIITAVKAATRRKHTPLNGYVSLSRDTAPDGGFERCLADVIPVRGVSDPAEIVLSSWEIQHVRRGFVDSLSPFETQVLAHYIDGMSYRDTAVCLGSHTKAVDNALQRAKRKLESEVTRYRLC